MPVLPDSLWRKELIEEVRSPRTAASKLILSLILLGPLAADWVPEHVKASGLVITVIFIGVFGSAVGVMGMRKDRMAERLAVLPTRPEALASDYMAANALIDGLQLAFPATLIFLSGHPELTYAPWAVLCYATALLSATAVGTLVAMLARSPGEVHLYAFMGVISVALLSGLLGLPLGVLGYIEPVSPFWQLSNALLFSWGSSELDVPLASPISGTAIFFTALFFSNRLLKCR